MQGDQLVSTGGRVLGVAGMGDNVKQAQETAYKAVAAIDWKEGFNRKDIGYRAIARLG